MADSPNTLTAPAIPQSPSRRNMLAADAAAIGATAVAGPVALGAVAGDDRIFAALAEWRRLNAAHSAAPEDTAERDAAFNALMDFEREALFPLRPTSVAGVVAMLKFVADPRLALVGDEVYAVLNNSIEFLERGARS